jgi:hypothetical protein
MSDPTNTFSLGNPQIAQCVWNCVQTTSVSKDNTVYNPPPPSTQGTSSTPAAGGQVDLNFSVKGRRAGYCRLLLLSALHAIAR